jgi:transcriptional regulator with GAF, ATPase, and Fis domain
MAFEGMISGNEKMHAIFSLIDKIARANSTVMILGESGTGKELIASALHARSGRSGKLVPVNCGAIPEEILESELFGHEKGSFTGAISSRIGRFQLAQGGTIFLDEIGEMSPKLQVKLLRVLQERRVDPVGSSRSIDIDVRVIAATNKDLREEVKRGTFREDLYYRLQVVPIELPPLRDRGDDALTLAKWFLKKFAADNKKSPLVFSERVEHFLLSYNWPGNIRELENLIERLTLLAEGGKIRSSDLPQYMYPEVIDYALSDDEEGLPFTEEESEVPIKKIESKESNVFPLPLPETIIYEDLPLGGVDFNGLINAYENKLIILALERTNWNKKAAAELLNLNRTTLVEKIRKKGLEFKDDADCAA